MFLAILAAVALAGPANAQGGDAATVCDTLIAARRVDAASGAAQAAPSEAGCRKIPRSEIGTVEQRALIGGAPYECMTIASVGHCLWVVP